MSSGRVSGVLGSRGDRARSASRSRFVVGADGLRSRVARLVEAPYTEIRPAGSGAAHYAYFAGDWPAMEYYIGDRSFAGIFPTNDGEACVWACSRSEDAERIRRSHRSVDDALNAMLHLASPELAERILADRDRERRGAAASSASRTSSVTRSVRAGRWSATPAITETPLLATGSATPSATPNWRRPRSTGCCAGAPAKQRALAAYHAERDAQLREDLTPLLSVGIASQRSVATDRTGGS